MLTSFTTCLFLFLSLWPQLHAASLNSLVLKYEQSSGLSIDSFTPYMHVPTEKYGGPYGASFFRRYSHFVIEPALAELLSTNDILSEDKVVLWGAILETLADLRMKLAFFTRTPNWNKYGRLEIVEGTSHTLVVNAIDEPGWHTFAADLFMLSLQHKSCRQFHYDKYFGKYLINCKMKGEKSPRKGHTHVEPIKFSRRPHSSNNSRYLSKSFFALLNIPSPQSIATFCLKFFHTTILVEGQDDIGLWLVNGALRTTKLLLQLQFSNDWLFSGMNLAQHAMKHTHQFDLNADFRENIKLVPFEINPIRSIVVNGLDANNYEFHCDINDLCELSLSYVTKDSFNDTCLRLSNFTEIYNEPDIPINDFGAKLIMQNVKDIKIEFRGGSNSCEFKIHKHVMVDPARAISLLVLLHQRNKFRLHLGFDSDKEHRWTVALNKTIAKTYADEIVEFDLRADVYGSYPEHEFVIESLMSDVQALRHKCIWIHSRELVNKPTRAIVFTAYDLYKDLSDPPILFPLSIKPISKEFLIKLLKSGLMKRVVVPESCIKSVNIPNDYKVKSLSNKLVEILHEDQSNIQRINLPILQHYRYKFTYDKERQTHIFELFYDLLNDPIAEILKALATCIQILQQQYSASITKLFTHGCFTLTGYFDDAQDTLTFLFSQIFKADGKFEKFRSKIFVCPDGFFALVVNRALHLSDDSVAPTSIDLRAELQSPSVDEKIRTVHLVILNNLLYEPWLHQKGIWRPSNTETTNINLVNTLLKFKCIQRAFVPESAINQLKMEKDTFDIEEADDAKMCEIHLHEIPKSLPSSSFLSFESGRITKSKRSKSTVSDTAARTQLSSQKSGRSRERERLAKPSVKLTSSSPDASSSQLAKRRPLSKEKEKEGKREKLQKTTLTKEENVEHSTLRRSQSSPKSRRRSIDLESQIPPVNQPSSHRQPHHKGKKTGQSRLEDSEVTSIQESKRDRSALKRSLSAPRRLHSPSIVLVSSSQEGYISSDPMDSQSSRPISRNLDVNRAGSKRHRSSSPNPTGRAESKKSEERNAVQ